MCASTSARVWKLSRVLAASECYPSILLRSFHRPAARPQPPSARPNVRLTQPFSATAHHPHPHYVNDSTIYALSTAPGRAAIAVIRLSGPACKEIFAQLCPGTPLPKPRYAVLRTIHEASKGHKKGPILDSGALVLSFPGPKSVTGEDVLEFHVHGGIAVVKAVLAAISKCNASDQPVRYAEPGEFTRRAFANDRLDLPQIEALGDTLAAVTEEQRRLSVQGTISGLADRYESWRDMLLQARGELEALIDFSEDQHFDESPNDLAASVAVQVRNLMDKLVLHSANAVRGELLRNGIALSLLGQPNVGKSSILNQIVGRNAAIVSQEAGTTRDIVEVGIDIGGFFCRLGDTAGLRQVDARGPDHAGTVGEIEQEGMRRAKEQAAKSDVVILVLSIEPSIDGQGVQLQLDNEVLATANDLLAQGKTVVAAINKMDRYGSDAAAMAQHLAPAVEHAIPGINGSDIFCLSCHDAAQPPASSLAAGGFANLVNGLVRTFRRMTAALTPRDDHEARARAGPASIPNQNHHSPDPTVWEESLGATERQRVLLDTCLAELRAFLALVPENQAPGEAGAHHDVDIVVAAESLRAAADCLGRITGRGEAGDVEEVLGVVFEK